MNTIDKEIEVTKLTERPIVGDIISAKVLVIDRTLAFIDLSPFGTGIIYGREFLNSREILKKTRTGDVVSAQVIGNETPDGYIDLSLREARKANILREIESSIKNQVVYTVKVKNVNRGGLIVDWDGIKGFLPASQLTEENYPKVLNRDKESILNELKKLIDRKIKVKIVATDERNDNLILAEVKDTKESTKQGTETEDEKQKDEIKVGDIKKGMVTGIVDFGVFVRLNNNVEGLVHISEMDWGLVDDPRKFYSVGDNINVKITEIGQEKISLSIKALKKNPWDIAGEKYKTGDDVLGVVIKYNQHGAFVSIEAGITGLVHVSSFKDDAELREKLQLGRTYEFIINSFEPKEQKLILNPKP